MPFLIRYPKIIKPGSICPDIISNVDFAATFLDLAGLTIPTYMQGRPFTKLLQGATPANWQQVAYYRYWMHNEVSHETCAHYGVRNQKYKIIYWYNKSYGLPGTRPGGEEPEWELFDCDADPLELVNIFHDPDHTETVRQMQQVLNQKMAEIGDIPEH